MSAETFTDGDTFVARTNARWLYDLDAPGLPSTLAIHLLTFLLDRGWTITVPEADLVQSRSAIADAIYGRPGEGSIP